jgi:hypothetical protein
MDLENMRQNGVRSLDAQCHNCRHRAVKPEAAIGGGPKGQALQPDGGEQTIELAIR